MARLTGALFSLAASGTIADTLTFAKWKGIQYVRTRVIPANPNTADQQDVRGIFSTLCEMWKRMGTYARAPWISFVAGKPLTARNKHIGESVGVLQAQADMDNLVMSVATGQALPPVTITPADAGGQVLTIACTVPAAPIGYTLEACLMLGVLDGDPSPVIIRQTFEARDIMAPFSQDLAVGVAGDYQCAAIVEYTRDSDGSTHYSDALRDQQAIA